MKKLLFFELKKIFSRKWIGVGILLLLASNILNFLNGGFQDVAYEREIAERYEGELDDKKVQQMLEEFLPTPEELEQWKGIPAAYIGRNSIQEAVQLYFANDDGTWNGKTVKEVFGEEPVWVGDFSGWMNFSRHLVRIMVGLAVLSIVMTASSFAGEYEGMDALILTSRYGRGKCAAAKILAAFLGPLVVSAVFVTGNFLTAFLWFGGKGLKSSVVFTGISFEHYMRFNISCGVMLAYQTALFFSSVLLLLGMVILVSSLAKNTVISLIVSTALFLGPLFFPAPETQPMFRVIGLLPIFQIQFSSLMCVEQIKGNLLYAAAAIPVSLLISVLCTTAAGKIWRRHQVA